MTHANTPAASLPVVDLGPMLCDGEGGLAQVASDIGKACRDVGFFYIQNHGIPAEQMTQIFVTAKTFFSRSDEEKMKIQRNRTNCGYVPMKGERLNSQVAAADLKEAFNVGLELPVGDPRLDEPLRAHNQWPGEEQAGGGGGGGGDAEGAVDQKWKGEVLEYFNSLLALGRQLHQAFSVDLGLNPNHFVEALVDPACCLRLLHYPPAPEAFEAGQQGCGIHTDYGNCTILLPDEVGGLQVQQRDGTWISPPSIPGTFIVNIGDLMMRWTNEVYVSTPHQVIHTAKKDRYSVAFFFEPNPMCEVSCLETCRSSDRPAKFPTVKAWEHIMMKLDASYKPMPPHSAGAKDDENQHEEQEAGAATAPLDT